MFVSRSKAFPVILLLGLLKSAYGCGDGESMSVSSEYRCCSVNHDIVAYKYSVDGGTHDDNIKVNISLFSILLPSVSTINHLPSSQHSP